MPLSLPTCSRTMLRFGCISFLRLPRELVFQVGLLDVVHRDLEQLPVDVDGHLAALRGAQGALEVATRRVADRPARADLRELPDETAEVGLHAQRAIEARRRDLEVVRH